MGCQVGIYHIPLRKPKRWPFVARLRFCSTDPDPIHLQWTSSQHRTPLALQSGRSHSRAADHNAGCGESPRARDRLGGLHHCFSPDLLHVVLSHPCQCSSAARVQLRLRSLTIPGRARCEHVLVPQDSPGQGTSPRTSQSCAARNGSRPSEHVQQFFSRAFDQLVLGHIDLFLRDFYDGVRTAGSSYDTIATELERCEGPLYAGSVAWLIAPVESRAAGASTGPSLSAGRERGRGVEGRLAEKAVNR